MNTSTLVNFANEIIDHQNIISLDLDQIIESNDKESELRIQTLVNDQLRQQLHQKELESKSSPLANLPEKVKKQIKMFSILKQRYKKLSKDFSEAVYKTKLLKIELNELKDSHANQTSAESHSEDNGALTSDISEQLRHLQNNQDLLISQQKQENQILTKVLGSADNNLTWVDIRHDMPKKSGIYLLTNGMRQCIGFYNDNTECFSSTSFFNKPTHWMTLPNLPSVEK